MPAAAKAKTPLKSAKKSMKSVVPDDMLGQKMPTFSLPATQIGTVSLSKLKGKPFVLYFYPKDDTSGCTAEACDFRDALPAFTRGGVAVIGISKDSLASHEKFAAKYHLSFPLAADTEGELCEKLGVWKQKSMYGRTYMGIERSTFLVDSKGVIRGVWRKVSVPGHSDAVKAALAEI